MVQGRKTRNILFVAVAMKKPTHKPKKKKPIPISSLIVDYGLKRVIMPYRVSLENYYDAQINEMHAWCYKTCKPDTYYQAGGWPGYMYFVRDKDATLFRLRWIT